MSTPLSTAVPVPSSAAAPPQRYGLGVMLRKPYPAMDNWKLETGNWKPTVRGAEPRTVPWENLPPALLDLVRRRAAADPVVAARVLQVPAVLFLDIPAQTTMTIDEPLESVLLREHTSKSGEGEGTRASVTLLRVGEGARVQWFAPLLAMTGFAFTERLVCLERGATLEYHGAAVGADALRENIHVVLAGEGATARVHTLFAGSADNQFDFGVTAEHRAPRTTSDLRAKGILGGKAQGVYRGLVRVEKNAVRSDGYQRCDALLLSPTAEVDPIPNLEIETNDVRCTHGVTVSHLNADQLFYLQSRGFTEAAARDLLIEGFAGTMLRSWPEGEREKLRQAVQGTLNSFT